jgi:hypothetical protein
MSNTPNANDMIPSETPLKATTTNCWAGVAAALIAVMATIFPAAAGRAT